MKNLSRLLFVFNVLFLVAVSPALMSAASPAAAETAPASLDLDHSIVSLIQGKRLPSGWEMGVEIKLKKGWKTYWRNPGVTGVPPTFDWKNSVNTAEIKVLYPAPNRYADPIGETIGYKDSIIFPVEVTPGNPARKSVARLDLFYAVCSDICVPVQAKLQLEFKPSGVQQSDIDKISNFRSLVPHQKSDDLQIASARVTKEDGKFNLAVTLTGPASEISADIFVEGPGNLYFNKPAVKREESGNITFELAINGLKTAEELRGKTIRITTTSGGIRLEKSQVVD